MNLEWAERLNGWLAEAGWSVAEYARRVNADGGPEISEYSIRKYLDGKVAQPRGNAMDRLARPFGKTGLQLLTGLERITSGGTKIPLLRANELGTLDPTRNGKAWEGRSVIVLSNDVGPNWFGFEVDDNACAPKIIKGSTVYCDMDATPVPGDYVVAHIPDQSGGVCRRYRQPDGAEPDRFVLVPEDDDYPEFKSSPERPIKAWKIVKILSDP